MIKQEITYTDFNGVEQTTNVYFNLTKREAMNIGLNKNEGLMKDLTEASEMFKNIKNIDDLNDDEKNNIIKTIVKIIDVIVEASYGIRSEDGAKFIKNKENTEEFMSSLVYDSLFEELISDIKKFTMFISGLLPDSDELTKLVESIDA